MDDYDKGTLLKIILLGELNAGKTSTVSRYVHTSFASNYKCTIGVDFYVKTLTVDNRIVKLQIWDTASQEKYLSMTRSYYYGISCCLLCFDLNDEKSFNRLDYWRNELLQYQNYNSSNENKINVPIVLIGNKLDNVNRDARVIKKETIEKWCLDNQISNYLETSAKEAINIDEAFLIVAKNALEYHDKINNIENPYIINNINNNNTNNNGNCYSYC